MAASSKHLIVAACAAGRQGAGAWQPLAPYNPLPPTKTIFYGKQGLAAAHSVRKTA